jgi:hypothetical protein
MGRRPAIRKSSIVHQRDLRGNNTDEHSLNAEAPQREFHYNGIRIPDAGLELTVEQVRDLLPITQKGATALVFAQKRQVSCCATHLAVPSA